VLGSSGRPATPVRSAPVSSRFITFGRDEWRLLRDNTPLTLTETDLDHLRGINERIDLAEVADVYLPLSRLLNLHVAATQQLNHVSATFLGTERPHVPYIIGIAGSVAVGKSTSARILQALLSRWPEHPAVDLVTTDGFLRPNAELEARGIMNRKGFPESYDTRRLLEFLREVKSGFAEVGAPVYSHLAYDIVPDERVVVRRPDVVILEGLNVLQVADRATEFVSDFFDFSIYVDADEADVERWYVERFLALRGTAFRQPGSFFREYAPLGTEDAVDTARGIWRDINGRNLRENIAPSRERAMCIVRKGGDHRVTEVRLRK
jgi:type I pantothenate kinase